MQTGDSPHHPSQDANFQEIKKELGAGFQQTSAPDRDLYETIKADLQADCPAQVPVQEQPSTQLFLTLSGDLLWNSPSSFISCCSKAKVVMDLAFHVPSAFISYFLFKPQEQWAGGMAFANASNSRSAKTPNKGCEKNISAGSICWNMIHCFKISHISSSQHLQKGQPPSLLLQPGWWLRTEHVLPAARLWRWRARTVLDGMTRQPKLALVQRQFEAGDLHSLLWVAFFLS